VASPWALRAVSAPDTIVSQKARMFDPGEIAIAKGATVRFTNDDPFLHQMFVLSPSFSFDSDEQSPGQMKDVVFPSEGDFNVLCGIHPKMSLKVRVR
jgi:plastocyanin